MTIHELLIIKSKGRRNSTGPQTQDRVSYDRYRVGKLGTGEEIWNDHLHYGPRRKRTLSDSVGPFLLSLTLSLTWTHRPLTTRSHGRDLKDENLMNNPFCLRGEIPDTQ